MSSMCKPGIQLSTEGSLTADRGARVPPATLSGRLIFSELTCPDNSGSSLEEIISKDKKAGSRQSQDASRDSAPFNEAVLRQLTRILQSKTFIQSDKLCRFLRFVVEHVLDGDSRCIKEYLIGVEVYGRRPPYDPSQDSIVRTEARRLRSKLKLYYENEGKEDSIYIYLLPGSYIPVVQFSGDRRGLPSEADVMDSTLPISAAILPFRDLSKNPISSAYARGIPDELAYVLMLTQGCKVISPSSLEYFHAQEHEISTTMKRVGAEIAFEGSVRAEGSHLRITARIVDTAGIQLWTKRIDAEVETGTFATEEQIAFALSDGFSVVRSLVTGFRQHSSITGFQRSKPQKA